MSTETQFSLGPFRLKVETGELLHAGHFMVLEQPEAVAQAVSEFLGAVST